MDLAFILQFSVIFLIILEGRLCQHQGCGTQGKEPLNVQTDQDTIVTGPNYPSNYVQSTSCTWVIKCPPEYLIKVAFIDFSLNALSSNRERCSMRDFLQFCDGSCDSGQTLGLYCGTLHANEVYSVGNTLSVKFQSSLLSSSTSRGFKLKLRAVPKAATSHLCLHGRDNDNIRIHGSHGTIYSPNYPIQYPDTIQCTWVISVPEGKRVKVTFEEFDLTTSIGIECSVDYIEIRDGNFQKEDKIDKFCSAEKPNDSPIYSRGCHMWMRFVSKQTVFDMYRTSGRFKATFEAADKSYKGKIIGGIAGSVALLLIVLCCVCSACRKKRKKLGEYVPPSPPPPSLADSCVTASVPHNPPPSLVELPSPVNPSGQLPPPPSYYTVVYDRSGNK